MFPFAYFYLPKSARAYLFPQSVKLVTFAAAPLVLTPFVRNRFRDRSCATPALSLSLSLPLSLSLSLYIYIYTYIYIYIYIYIYVYTYTYTYTYTYVYMYYIHIYMFIYDGLEVSVGAFGGGGLGEAPCGFRGGRFTGKGLNTNTKTM